MNVQGLLVSRLCQRLNTCWKINIGRYSVNCSKLHLQKDFAKLKPFANQFLQTSGFISEKFYPCRYKSKTASNIEKRKRMLPPYLQLRSVCIVVTNDKPVDQDSVLNNLPYLEDIEDNVIACSRYNMQLPTDYSSDNSYNSNEMDNLNTKSLFDNTENMFELKQSKDIQETSSLVDSAEVDDISSPGEGRKEKFSYNVFQIEDTAKTIDEWRDILDQLSEICEEYSKNIIIKSLMSLFLIGRSDDLGNVLTTPLLQSFVDYVVEYDDVLEIAQPSLVIYLNNVMRFKEYDMAMELYRRVNKKIKVYSKSLLFLFVEAANLQSMESSTYCTSTPDDLMKICHTYESIGLIEGIAPFLSLYGVGAFKRRDPETGIKIMMILLEKNEYSRVDDRLMDAFLSYHKYTDDNVKWEGNCEVVEACFNFLCSKSVPLNKNCARSIGKWFRSIKNRSWSLGCFSNREISKGFCPVSHVRINKSILSQNEFECLKQEVLQLLVTQVSQDINPNVHNYLGKEAPDLFYVSSLPSFTNFLHHLNEEGPFDLIIDGMNLIHSTFSSFSETKTFLGKHRYAQGLTNLGNILKDYQRTPGNGQKKICVVFRKHLKKHVKMDGRFLFDLADIYFTEADSADDAFILYAAISSGPDCSFSSNDLFRNYRYKVSQWCGADILKVFDKYQQTHQTFILHGRRRQPYLSSAVAYDTVIQKSPNAWHVPYIDSTQRVTNIPQDWLCATTQRKISKRYTQRAEALIREDPRQNTMQR